MQSLKRTKIVCTIGPASSDKKILASLIHAGMNVARLNFSHGTHEDHAAIFRDVHAVAKDIGESIAVLQDLQGPKVRVGELPDGGVVLTAGEDVIFTTSAHATLPKITVSHQNLHTDVKRGDRMLLDDGLLEVVVEKIDGQDIFCKIINGGMLTSHKGINLPTTSVSIPAITEKDEDDIRFGVGLGVDWIALSFVRDANDVRTLRTMLDRCAKEQHIAQSLPIRIIAKIEKHEALKNIDEIIAEADGVMVARGDLGVEIPAEEVPVAQKMIIQKCLIAAKPVIVATQMLDSMIRNPRPTRAEVSDVANAVIDHTDAVMLSGETATGKYPVESVETMARIVREAETSAYDDVVMDCDESINGNTAAAISEVAKMLARDLSARLILVASLSGETGRQVSRFRPQLPLIVATNVERVARQLVLSWGVVPMIISHCTTIEGFVDQSLPLLRAQGLVQKGDRIIVVAGKPMGNTGGANLVSVEEVP